jgi:hypothetical protein
VFLQLLGRHSAALAGEPPVRVKQVQSNNISRLKAFFNPEGEEKETMRKDFMNIFEKYAEAVYIIVFILIVPDTASYRCAKVAPEHKNTGVLFA